MKMALLELENSIFKGEFYGWFHKRGAGKSYSNNCLYD